MYVQNCTCEYAEAEEPRYFGHLRWCLEPVTDYEHDLNALLEPLGVLRERGWADWNLGPGKDCFEAVMGHRDGRTTAIRHADSPSEALALAVAEALEVSK